MGSSLTSDSAVDRRETRPGSGEMFDRIAERYDLLNRVISLGTDRIWRRRAVDALGLRPGSTYLDLATGTGDVALEILEREPGARVVGVDPSTGMLGVGQTKVAGLGLADRIELREGIAERLPLATDSVAGALIAFGIRNVPDRSAGLAEMARVVAPGGRVVVLELTDPRGGWLAPFARFHVHQVVPRLGALLSGEPEYRYLARSIAAFPPPAEFASMMEDAGLVEVAFRAQTFGVCHLYVGRVPA